MGVLAMGVVRYRRRSLDASRKQLLIAARTGPALPDVNSRPMPLNERLIRSFEFQYCWIHALDERLGAALSFGYGHDPAGL